MFSFRTCLKYIIMYSLFQQIWCNHSLCFWEPRPLGCQQGSTHIFFKLTKQQLGFLCGRITHYCSTIPALSNKRPTVCSQILLKRGSLFWICWVFLCFTLLYTCSNCCICSGHLAWPSTHQTFEQNVFMSVKLCHMTVHEKLSSVFPLFCWNRSWISNNASLSNVNQQTTNCWVFLLHIRGRLLHVKTFSTPPCFAAGCILSL